MWVRVGAGAGESVADAVTVGAAGAATGVVGAILSTGATKR